MAKIALVTVPFFSHVEASMRLAEVLARQGHEMIVWGPERSREHVEGWNGRFEVQDMEMPRVAGLGFAAELTATTERVSEELIERLFRHDVDLLIHDSRAPWARVAGDYLGIPRIVSFPLFPLVTQYRVPSNLGLNWPSSDPAQAAARFEANWLSIARRWGVAIESLDNVSAETTITFTTEKILGDIGLRPGWHCVGPLMSPPPTPAPRGERPLVYVCFGTSFNKRPELFRAALTGLAREPVDVLVSAGNGPISTDAVGPLPSNVTWREFVPARAVLARASAHITHGGCNSVHESLLAGVPMVFLPQGYDQFPLARSVELLGAGLIAEEDPSEIRAAVLSLLDSDEARARARELSEHLAGYDGERRAADVVERVLSEQAALTASQQTPGG